MVLYLVGLIWEISCLYRTYIDLGDYNFGIKCIWFGKLEVIQVAWSYAMMSYLRSFGKTCIYIGFCNVGFMLYIEHALLNFKILRLFYVLVRFTFYDIYGWVYLRNLRICTLAWDIVMLGLCLHRVYIFKFWKFCISF